MAQHPTEPHTPNVLVRFTSSDDSPGNIRASLEYVAVPVMDIERLKAAATALEPHLPSPLPPGIGGAKYEPLVVESLDQLKLLIALPKAGGSGSLRQERANVVTSLTEPFRDIIGDLTLDHFREVFDALFRKSAVMLTGEVVVKGSARRPDERVPFAARLDDLYGPVLVTMESAGTDGSVEVILRNAIESPVVIKSLPVQIADANNVVVDARVEQLHKEGVAAALPTRLAPGESLSCRVLPSTQIIGTPHILFDLDEIEVGPDATAGMECNSRLLGAGRVFAQGQGDGTGGMVRASDRRADYSNRLR